MKYTLATILTLLALLATASLAGPKPPRVKIVNRDAPGERVVIQPHLVAGNYTIVEFFSNHCPPCREIGPLLTELAQRRRDLYVRRIDIDRRGASAIDWSSPVAKQYDIHRVPHFRIYDPKGRLELEGAEAREQVKYWMQESAVVR